MIIQSTEMMKAYIPPSPVIGIIPSEQIEQWTGGYS